MKEKHMKTTSTFISLMVMLALAGCGNNVKVESFETTMQCFRNHVGIQCLGRGIQCHQPFRARQLTCRVTMLTSNGVRKDMPTNPIQDERIITWDR